MPSMPHRRSSSASLLPHRSPSSWHSAHRRSPSSPSLAAGFSLEDSIAEEPEPAQMDRPFAFQPFRPLPSPSAIKPSAEGPDRLDRLLAEFDAQVFGSSSKTINQPESPSPPESTDVTDQEDPEESDWEDGLVSMSSSPIERRCECSNCGLRNRSTSRASSERSGGSGGSGEESWPSVRVRFCEGAAEQVLTWSAETYDRKGPEPISRLSMREVIELKLIKEEVLALGPQL